MVLFEAEFLLGHQPMLHGGFTTDPGFKGKPWQRDVKCSLEPDLLLYTVLSAMSSLSKMSLLKEAPQNHAVKQLCLL